MELEKLVTKLRAKIKEWEDKEISQAICCMKHENALKEVFEIVDSALTQEKKIICKKTCDGYGYVRLDQKDNKTFWVCSDCYPNTGDVTYTSENSEDSEDSNSNFMLPPPNKIVGRAKSPEQKKQILDSLLSEWLKVPELRFGQLLVAATAEEDNLFSLEDSSLLYVVSEFVKLVVSIKK